MEASLPLHLRRTLRRWGLREHVGETRALAASRNLTIVCRSGSRRVLVKASSGPADLGVDFEAELLPRLTAVLSSRGAPLVPSVYAAAPGILALQWLPAETLFVRRRRGVDHQEDARLGGALAALHAVPSDAHLPTRNVPGDLASRLVWTSPELYASLSAASVALWGTVQADDRAIAELSWLLDVESRAPGRFVHGDLRHPNVLVRPDDIALVDWESAGWGDPARDLGMLLAEDFAVHLMPPATAPMSAAVLKRHLRTVLRSYRDAATLPLGPAFSRRVMGWTAEALLRRVYTVAYHEGRLESGDTHLLECAVELLRNSTRHAKAFFGSAA